MASTIKNIAFVAGKSGGHIIPCISIMHQHYSEKAALFFTTDATLDSMIMQHNLSDAIHIALPLNHSRISLWTLLPLMWRLIASFYTSMRTLKKYNPEKIITTGGLVSLPVCIAGWFLHIPIEVYELNAIPGKATKALRFIATYIYVCFKHTISYFPASMCSVIDYPLRYNAYEVYEKDTIRKLYGLQNHVRTVLVLGGSQGSIGLNTLLKQTLHYRTQPLQIIHQTGSADATNWQEWYKNQNISAYVSAYEHNLAPFLSSADIVICRAGAGTLFEVSHFKKPCIVVPLEGLGGNHQVANAYALQKQKADCIVLRQKEAEKNPRILIKQIEECK